MRQESAYIRQSMMRSSKRRKMAVSVMAAILLVLLYRLIFVFSGQDGEESGSLSASECYLRETLDAECPRQYGGLF